MNLYFAFTLLLLLNALITNVVAQPTQLVTENQDVLEKTLTERKVGTDWSFIHYQPFMK